MSRGVQIPITPATPTASRSTTPSIHPPACATARHPRARGGRASRRAAPRPGLAPQTPRAGCRWGTLAPSSSVHTVIGATLGHAAAAGSAQEKLCRAAALKFPQNCARLSPASGDSRAATGSTRCARCVAKLSRAASCAAPGSAAPHPCMRSRSRDTHGANSARLPCNPCIHATCTRPATRFPAAPRRTPMLTV